LTASGDTITAPDSAPAKAAKRGRRVGFGTVTDRKFAGPGVRVAKVLRGSPAEKAGLVAGDVILLLEGRQIQDRQAFASLIAELAPGQSVAAVVRRAARDWMVSLTLAPD
jgi:S1-C subfamily serine protease